MQDFLGVGYPLPGHRVGSFCGRKLSEIVVMRCGPEWSFFQDHIEHMLDMIEIGKGGQREIDDVKLSRYACYLIVQNTDPGKEVVALGQTYFALQTRLQELQQLDAYKQK